MMGSALAVEQTDGAWSRIGIIWFGRDESPHDLDVIESPHVSSGRRAGPNATAAPHERIGRA